MLKDGIQLRFNVSIQHTVFEIVTPCSVVNVPQTFRGELYLRHHRLTFVNNQPPCKYGS